MEKMKNTECEIQKRLTILINPFGGYGNINPALGIAESLHRRGHRIVFILNEIFADQIKNNNDIDEIIVAKGDNDEFWTKLWVENQLFQSTKSPLEKAKAMIPQSMRHIFNTIKQYDEFMKTVIERIQPNLIINDAVSIVIPSIVNSGRPWISYVANNPLFMIDDERTPPTQSGLPTNDSTEWSRFREEYHKSIKQLWNDINEWIVEHDLTPLPPYKLHYESPLLNIYNCPKQLDYCEMRPLASNWVRFDAFMRTENEDFQLPNQFTNNDKKLIYLSMGSITSTNVIMMKRLINILSQTPHQYVVSKGYLGDTYELPINMYGKPMLPQTKVMPLVDMVIIHGGQSGLVEACYFGKPMIVMPLCFDQFDNAQRVVEEGMGLRMDPNTCTDEQLITAIQVMLNDEQLVKRMKQLSLQIQNETKSNKLASIIEELL